MDGANALSFNGQNARRVRRNQTADLVFAVLGVAVMVFVLGLLLTLVTDLFVDGAARLSPVRSRPPEESTRLAA